ncbi:multiple sugar transport system permease protein [Paenibacillus sp. UNCCL117]|uniref:carbohydrate ABC transporter permease n=1 Tax=unclassified Paenibacillus TaxID=185978 RepID=UPI000883B133|nr:MULTISPECIES: carbohydrate ABC transporter permease [unclassified Paenibacillus]SDD55783.1 carbohydrate ABC transporter membrane protein 2, CUT1 family [Paenibacillus sp. cl123]SFW51517.1 multiple sugar transport system permease protein [Paenibacillus sp. UNCCL117]
MEASKRIPNAGPAIRAKPRAARLGRKAGQVLKVAVLTALTVIFLWPMAVTLTNAFMSEAEITRNYAAISGTDATSQAEGAEEPDYVSLHWIPERATLSQLYAVLIGRPQFLFMFWNSLKMTVPIIAGQIVVASLAAYAFAHLRFRFREPLFFAYIVTMLMPFQVTLVPNFIVADKLGLLDTYGAIIFPGIFSAFGVFLLRQFMMFVPGSYIEAARVDGASHLYIFAKIIWPMSGAGIAALAILVFIDNWNMVEQPLIFLKDAVKQPLSVYLSVIGEEERGIAFAASAIYMLPLLLVALYAEKYLVEGIQLSGLKG